MNALDKIFKIGLLLIGIGFLVLYGIHVIRSAGNQSPASRYLLTVGEANGGHTIYLVDTSDGTVFYADRGLVLKSLQWQASNPKQDTSK